MPTLAAPRRLLALVALVAAAATARDYRTDRDIDAYMDAGRHGFGTSQHFWWVPGHGDLPYAVYPVPQKGAYRGPFTNPCIMQAALSYLNDVTLPAEGSVRTQSVPAFPTAGRSTTDTARRLPVVARR